MTSEEYKALIQRYIEAYNAFDVDRMLRLMHDDVIFRNFSDGKVTLTIQGKEELRKQAEQAAAAFSSRRQQWLNFRFVSDDAVEVDIDYEGVLAVDVSEAMKRGEKLQLKGKSVFSFKDDKIVLLEDYS